MEGRAWEERGQSMDRAAAYNRVPRNTSFFEDSRVPLSRVSTPPRRVWQVV